MNWLRRLVKRDPVRQRKGDDLERLDQRAQRVIDRSERTTAEAERLADALRKTVKAMRAEQKHW